MFLKSPIGKLNEHMNIHRDCLPGEEGKCSFYAGVDLVALPQIRRDSLSPNLQQSIIWVGGINHLENKRFPGVMCAI